MRRLFLYIAAITILGLAYSQTIGVRRHSATDDHTDGADTTASNRVMQAPLDTNSIIDILTDSVTVTDGTGSPNDTVEAIDITFRDTIPPDSTRKRFSRIDRSQVDLEDVVTFNAKDSMVMHGNNNAFLYGGSTVKYTEFNIESDQIRMELDSNTVYATGTLDSIGELQGTPVFSDRNGEYEAREMRYNFKTQRGYITDIITEQGEGFLTGGVAKKNADGSFFGEDGKYTTCDDHEHPHFYFQITKYKMKPQKDVVTGPGYMVLAGVPLPLALPFGYFPFSKDYSSGIIFPSFGDDYNRGYYLRDGGYYFAFSDYVDLALRGEIYTKGSWGISAHSTYTKRYKFSGSFDISFLTTITGDKGTPDYSKMKNFQVLWSHTQDAKANPNMNFSASVNFTTSGYSRNDLNSYYNNSFTENTKSSTVSFSYRFPGTKWSVAATANIAQRSQDSTLAVSFPNLNITMSQLAPFKRKRSVGGEKWYEKIKMSYSGQFQNSLTARENEFFKKSLVKDWKNGMRHSVPISATFNIFKYINLSPSVQLNDRMYTSKIKRMWDPNQSAEIQDTTYGFYNIFDFNASLSFDTKFYGFYKPLKIFGDKIQMIRHVISPTMSFSASPDFGAPMWGVHDFYEYTDQSGNNHRVDYSYFNHGIFGVPGRGKSGMVSFSLANNLEMKVKDENDSTGMRKISLIENLSLSQSYNFAADSLNWSPLNASINMRLTKDFNLNLNSTWDPYTYQLSPSGSPVQVNVPRWKAGKGWVRLSSAGTSFSYTFNNSTFKREKKDNSSGNNNGGPGEGEGEEGEEGAEGDLAASSAGNGSENSDPKKKRRSTSSNSDQYYKWECPWSLTLNYSVNYSYGEFNKEKLEYNGKFTQNLSLSGSLRPTKNWNFSFSASYNFELHKLAYMNCSVSRDLHCFTMTASFVPVGPYKSYNFHIAVKSSLLSDVKYDKRSSNQNGIDWY